MTSVLSVIEGIATVVIAIYVASIGTLQWINAREKLRLDLYNRRFQVYANTMNYMQTVLEWRLTPADEKLAHRRGFVQAMYESRFLFADAPAVTVLLEEFNQRSFAMNEYVDRSSNMPAVFAAGFEQAHLEYRSNEKWLLATRNLLQDMLVPYLSFRHREFPRSVKNSFVKRQKQGAVS